MSIGQVSGSNPTNISALMRNNALQNFEKSKKSVEEQEIDLLQMEEEMQQEKERVNSASVSDNKYSKTIEEIKEFATSIGEELSDDDINYALRYGRSVLADYSA